MTDFERLRAMLEPKLGGWLSAAQIDDLVRYQLKQGVIVPPYKNKKRGDRQKRVLDPCCGSKMFWFDRDNPDVEFCDIRQVDNEVIWRSRDGANERRVSVHPDTICDVTALPFDDNTFWHVVFDPPHLLELGSNSWLCKKYGKLSDNWKMFIHDAFAECMRVLKPNGTLIFKWNETDILLKDVLSVIPYKPLYGHRSGKRMNTHWLAFIKDEPQMSKDDRRYRIVFDWSSRTPSGKFNPMMYCQLIDTTKQGPRKYVVPDLLFDCIKEGVTTDFKLYKYLASWIDKAFETYESEVT